MKMWFQYYNEMFNVMTSFWCYGEIVDVMTLWLHDKLFTSWHICDCYDKLLTLWQSFWRHGVFLMSWRTLWRHNELCDVITFSFNNKLDIMTSFFTSCRTFRTFRTRFEIMMKLLTSWQTFWHHDVFMTSWRIFDVTNCLTSCRMLHFLTSWRTFWRIDTLFDLMTNFLCSWHIYFIISGTKYNENVFLIS